MIILPAREKFIQETFLDRAVTTEEGELIIPTAEFQKLNTFEQYYLAQNYNWDYGVEILDLIIDSKNCDKGTALLIFWMSEPDFYFKYTLETIPSYESKVFLLLQKITKKFEYSSFNHAFLAFDPGEKLFEIDWSTVTGEWNIPASLKKPVHGVKPFSLSILQNLLWNWQRQKKLRKRAKKKRLKTSLNR